MRICNRFLYSFICNQSTVYLQALLLELRRLSRSSLALINTSIHLSIYEIIGLIKRLTLWPSSINLQALDQSVVTNGFFTGAGDLLRAQLVTTSPSTHLQSNLLAFHSIIANCNFPCSESSLPSLRSISPFTQTIRSDSVDVIYLSCVAYFEVKIEPTVGTENGSISIGLANPHFPKAGRCVGGDVNSFGYFSRDGCLYHGDDTVGIHFGPTFTTGDVIGCGLVYPPLAADQGEILFTRNGEIIGVVELLDVGLLDVPWYPIVGLNCEQQITFNYGNEEFRFPILEFEAEELKNRWGYESNSSTAAAAYCVHVYNQLLLSQRTNTHSISENMASSEMSNTYDTNMHMSLEQHPSITQTHSKTKFYGIISYLFKQNKVKAVSDLSYFVTIFLGTLSQVKSSWADTVVHEIPIRKRKFCDDDNDGKDPVVYQRFKTWTQSESAGSWAGSSINDSWEEDDHDTDIISNRKSLPRRDSDRSLRSISSDNQSIDETQSCIAVEGEMTLAEYLQMADSGVVVMQDPDGLDNRIIDEDIENDRAEKFEDEEENADEDDEDDNDDRSIATSLFVEVASVDGCGSYFGYGGSSESDDEVQEIYDQDHDDDQQKLMLTGSVFGESFYRASANSPQTSEKSSRHRWRGGKTFKEKKVAESPTTTFSVPVLNLNLNFSHPQEKSVLRSSNLRHIGLINSSLAARHNYDADGYDAASETGGRGDLTDGMEDFHTDVDICEEMDDQDNDSTSVSEKKMKEVLKAEGDETSCSPT